MYDYYKSLLFKDEIPSFLRKYLDCPTLIRLKNVGYFCGMDYASKNIYDFGEYISRFDHSLDVSLLTYKLTNSKEATLAGLFHDIATPCFAHVIDYMNKDYANQESTELLTEAIIKSDTKLLNLLKEDNIDVDDIINFKKYSIVDNDRPKLCADRLDGVILTGLFWTKNIKKEDIDNILNYLIIYKNEENELEIGVNDIKTSEIIMDVSESIDKYCHSNEDNYMMELLAKLTKYAIDNNYIGYEDLYILNEKDIHQVFESIKDIVFINDYYKFKNIKMEEVPFQEMPYVKKRNLNILVNGKRIK